MTYQHYRTHRKKELALKTASGLRKLGFKAKVVETKRPQQRGFMTIRYMTVYDVLVDWGKKK